MRADIPDYDSVVSSRKGQRLPAAGRNWLTRQEVVAEWPIAYSTLAKIPHPLLPYAKTGVTCSYERRDIETLFARLKQGITLADLIAIYDANCRDATLDSLRGIATTSTTTNPTDHLRGKRGRKPHPVIGR